ncbi:D-serine deaminase-like pyridoxal phosphate-dependent protein [Microbacterium sp. SLBN-154]|uniref:alanine racemase n=1 Tax=Microbacterium sp. SLBN-154 TaxID=2768458 RepID=UPI00116AAFA6|nr:alanine racemase [Microbacterium sp. SLBN-154]TQK20018.1 D-serine deaminase-like pyridoxal phosphate-dependent protein [Microbacterium sp. SLBN-154]
MTIDLLARDATANPSSERWRAPARYWTEMSAATAHLPAPLAAIDRQALSFNALDMVVRAGGVPIRVASKSIRVREVLDAVLRLPGYRGVLAFTLAEALWLSPDHDDIVLGYPTVDREGLARLAADDQAAARITLMVDDPAQLDLIDAIAPPRARPELRVAIDVDASWRAPGLGHIGVHRSPLHTAQEAVGFARLIAERPGFRLAGLMMYEAQIAGQPDAAGAGEGVIRWMQRRSAAELRERRAEVVERVREVAHLDFVNGGGTGSLESTAADPAVTELTAGSGLLAGHLFDGYRSFDPAPAAAFALDVVRIPAPGVATVLGGGWVASGPAAPSRLPRPVWPAGLRHLLHEGAGEVQTPLRGPAAAHLAVGDRVWFRHAKSGELAERVEKFVLVSDGGIVAEMPTYRGEGKAFL